MPAITNISGRFTGVDGILQDLLQGVDAFGGSIAFLVCNSNIDCPALVAALSAALPCPLVGGTSLSFPLSDSRQEISAILNIFKADGLECTVAVSEKLDVNQSQPQMQALYAACTGARTVPAQMFYTEVPRMDNLIGDRFIRDLFSQVGNVPVIGGMNSADLDLDNAAVFGEGKCWTDRVVLLAMGGGIQPVFSACSSLTPMSDYAPQVTKSDYNVVYELDGEKTFVDYLEEMGFGASGAEMESLFHHGPQPVLLYGKQAPDDELPEIRSLTGVDPANGSGIFSSKVPEGTRFVPGNLQKNDISSSAEACIGTLLQRMGPAQKAGYHYSFLICVPCVSRHLAQLGGPSYEDATILMHLPKGMQHTSFYSFYEVGPSYGSTGALYNRTLNGSIVMCAL